MIIEVKDGLMWQGGHELSALHADEVAYNAGCHHAERFVKKYAGRLVHINGAGKVVKTARPLNLTERVMRSIERVTKNQKPGTWQRVYKAPSLDKAYKAGLILRDRRVIHPKGIRWIHAATATRAELLKIYEQQKPVWHAKHPRCEWTDPVTGEQCRRKSSRKPHHKRRRGRYLCDTTTWMATCEGANNHHDAIHANEKEAERRGYIIRDRRTNTGLKLPPIITPLNEIE